IPDTCQVPWTSSGWNDDRSVNRLLEMLTRVGDVAITGRRDKLRVYDLAERVYPADLAVPAYEVARTELARRRLASLGIAGSSWKGGGEELGSGGLGEPVTVAGTEGEWRVDADALGALGSGAPGGRGSGLRGRAALLSPYDRLVYDRARALEL